MDISVFVTVISVPPASLFDIVIRYVPVMYTSVSTGKYNVDATLTRSHCQPTLVYHSISSAPSFVLMLHVSACLSQSPAPPYSTRKNDTCAYKPVTFVHLLTCIYFVLEHSKPTYKIKRLSFISGLFLSSLYTFLFREKSDRKLCRPTYVSFQVIC